MHRSEKPIDMSLLSVEITNENILMKSDGFVL